MPRTDTKRFWAKVNKTEECWLWTGALTKGYGQMRFDKTHYTSHRFSWQLHNGPIPNGLHVLHKCDVPNCVRPDHLFLGTALDNNRDAIAKGRRRNKPLLGEQNGSSKLTALEAATIRRRILEGEPAYKVAVDFGIGKSQAWNIGAGKSWRHINGI